jgi:pimeloyl-[acyl-carrier protein] methyl ester esterase
MKLHVESRGQGPDLVLLHGWAMHGGMWGPWLDEFVGVARLHIVDLPGHGHSPWVTGAGSLAGLAEAVVPLVPRGATVLGWSLGGMVALELARQCPRHLRALVLVATTPKFLVGPDWEHGLEPTVLDAFTRGLEADWLRTVQGFLALQARGDEYPAATLRTLRAHVTLRSEPDRRALVAGLDVLRNADLRRLLPQVELPALVIAGAHDCLTPVGAGRQLAAGLPCARLRIIERSGHAPFLSHPDHFLAEVRGFLSCQAQGRVA